MLETRYAVYFDGLGEADAIFDFEETAIGHAEENVNFDHVEYALVLAESDGTRRVIYETGVPPEDVDVLAVSVQIKPSARTRLSSLAERVCA